MSRMADKSREAISKTISAILRRDAKKLGLEIDGDGWVKLSDLLKTDVMRGVSELQLLTVIHESNEQKLRYELAAVQDGQAIRATSKRGTHKDLSRRGEPGTSSQILPSPSIMMSVSGLRGIICEETIPQDSTVMDARKVISAAAGIPIQKLQLALGCAVLADSSAALVPNPAGGRVDVTCIVSTMDAADVCAWCCKVLGVPVELHCSCKALYCVTCVRDMVGMNGQPPKCRNCPTCNEPLFRFGSKSASSVYKKRRDLVGHLDDKYGEVECPRGCGESYHRRNAQGHMDMCPRTVKICRLCSRSYTGQLAAHLAQCPCHLSDFLDGYLDLR